GGDGLVTDVPAAVEGEHVDGQVGGDAEVGRPAGFAVVVGVLETLGRRGGAPLAADVDLGGLLLARGGRGLGFAAAVGTAGAGRVGVDAEELAQDVLDVVVGAFAEVDESEGAFAVDDVLRRPVAVLEGVPDLHVGVERDRPVDPQLLDGPLDVG